MSREKGIALLNALLFMPPRRSPHYIPLTEFETKVADCLVQEGLLVKNGRARGGYEIRREHRVGNVRRDRRSATVWGTWKIRETFSPAFAEQIIRFLGRHGGQRIYLSSDQLDGKYAIYTSEGTFFSQDFQSFERAAVETAGPKAGRNETGHYLPPSASRT